MEPGAHCSLWAPGERVKEEGSLGALELHCGATLRPGQSTAGQGSHLPHLPPDTATDELMLSQKEERPGVRASGRQAARAWPGVRLPTVKATGSVGQGTRAPRSVSKSLETG